MGNVVAVISWNRSIFGSEFDNKIYTMLSEVSKEYGLIIPAHPGIRISSKKYFEAEIAGMSILWYGGQGGSKRRAQEFIDAADKLLEKHKVEHESHIDFLPM